jgi:hypothetical protein
VLFARRRFEFPHLALLDHNENVTGVIQLRAVLLETQWLSRRGPCRAPRCPQWWVPFRAIRTWALFPTEEDAQRLFDHHGDAALNLTGHNMSIERVTLELPYHVNIIHARCRNGDLPA